MPWSFSTHSTDGRPSNRLADKYYYYFLSYVLYCIIMMMMMYMFPHTQLNIIRSIENIKIVFINIIIVVQVLEQEMTRSVAKYREENKLTKQFWDWIQVFQAPVVQMLLCVKVGFWSPSSSGYRGLYLMPFICSWFDNCFGPTIFRKG